MAAGILCKSLPERPGLYREFASPDAPVSMIAPVISAEDDLKKPSPDIGFMEIDCCNLAPVIPGCIRTYLSLRAAKINPGHMIIQKPATQIVAGLSDILKCRFALFIFFDAL
jgi:hypothetical protein